MIWHKNETPDPNRRRHDAFDWATLGVLTLTLIAVCIYTFFTYKQLHVSQDTEQRQLRAYVAVLPIGVHDFGNKTPIEVLFKTQNGGLTPAYKVKILSNIKILPYPLPAYFSYVINDNENTKGNTLVANGTMGSFKNTESVLTSEEIHNILDGKSQRLYIVGLVSYEDIFGKSHKTFFCSAIGGPKLLKAVQNARTNAEHSITTEDMIEYCDQHNEAD